MIPKRDLALHIPVIHKGYLDFFRSKRKEIGEIYIMDPALVRSVSEFKPDIASLDIKDVVKFLAVFGFEARIVSRKNIKGLHGKKLRLINDEISRNLSKKYFSNSDIKWDSVFLRWDRTSVLSTNPVKNKTSNSLFDKKIMKMAYAEAKNSSDWWRQVGAILVKDEREVIATYNQSLPNDHAPYQMGAVRDFLNVGEKPELSNTIHGEQKIIAEAARQGVSLLDTSLYVTHFPCAVCAKLIAYSGIKRCFYGEGSANLDGVAVLKAAGIRITKVSI